MTVIDICQGALEPVPGEQLAAAGALLDQRTRSGSKWIGGCGDKALSGSVPDPDGRRCLPAARSVVSAYPEAYD